MLSHVWLFATPWTVAYQAPLSLELSRQEYWSGFPCHPPEDLPDPGIEPSLLRLLHLQAGLYHQRCSSVHQYYTFINIPLGSPTWQQTLTPRYLPERKENMSTQTLSHVFIVALFIIVKSWKQSKYWLVSGKTNLVYTYHGILLNTETNTLHLYVLIHSAI